MGILTSSKETKPAKFQKNSCSGFLTKVNFNIGGKIIILVGRVGNGAWDPKKDGIGESVTIQ